MKHNKKRNTAFIYEALSRELTKTIVNKSSSRKNKIIYIMKEHFSARTILGAELSLYQALLETSNTQIKVAERLLTETKEAHRRLDENVIFDAQSQLISAINKGLGKDVWANFVPNFKSLASISAIFNSKTAVKKRVLFEQAIIDKMSKEDSGAQILELRTLDNLTYNSFIKKFNDKYGDLIQEQKELLNRYVTSFADDGFELRLYLNEELSRLKGLLNEAAEAELEPLILQKINEVMEYLEGFRKREFSEADLGKVLKTQELVQELVTNDHN